MNKLIFVAFFAVCAFGQVAPNQPTMVFGSTGLNDISSGGIANQGASNHLFAINIVSTGTPDYFEWNEDGGTFSPSTAITGGQQNLAGGIWIKFASTTGHTLSTVSVNFWTIGVTASAAPNFIQRGPGAVVLDLTTKLRQSVNALDYGAVCNGLAHMVRGVMVDDRAAIQAALDSLPVVTYTAYGVIRAGAVELPNIPAYNGEPTGCLIGTDGLGLVMSPRVTFWARGGLPVIKTAANFAPAGATATVTGATSASPVVITAANSFANGDLVVCQGIQGPQPANNYYQTGAPWVISGVSGTGFTLNGSNASGYAAYISGGTCTKATQGEKFALTVLDPTPPVPNENFDTLIQNIQIDETAAGNQFASGIRCDCSIGSRVEHATVFFGYRGVVLAADNITVDDSTLTPVGLTGAPDPIGLHIIQVNGDNNSITLRNLKFNGENGNPYHPNFTGQTPALVVSPLSQNIDGNIFNFEQVGWPIYIVGTTPHISLRGILAGMDHCNVQGDCAQVVALGPNPTTGYGIHLDGRYLQFACGVTQIDITTGLGACDNTLPVSGGIADLNYYDIGFDSTNMHWTGANTFSTPFGVHNSAFGTNFGIDFNTTGSATQPVAGNPWFSSCGTHGLCIDSGDGIQPIQLGASNTAPVFLGGGGGQVKLSSSFDTTASIFNTAFGTGLDLTALGAQLNAGQPWIGNCGFGVCMDSGSAAHPVQLGSGNAAPISLGAGGGISTIHTGLTLNWLGAGIMHTNGSGVVSTSPVVAADIATTGVTAGSYGDSSHSSQVVVNAEGQVTGSASVAIASATVAAGTGLSGGGGVGPGGTITLTNAAPLNSISPGASCLGGSPHVTGVTASLAAGVITLSVTCGP